MTRAPFLRRLESAVLELTPAPYRRAYGKLVGRDSYQGGEVNRLLAEWVTTLMHPDDEARWSIRRLRARSRDLTRNNAYARGFLNALAVNVIGPHGIRLQAQVRNNDGNLARAINTKIETGWDEWRREYATIDGRHTLESFERLALKTVAGDGETFVRLWRNFDNPHGFALEAIDADLVDETLSRPREGGQNEIRLGIEVDEFARPVAYYVWDRPEKVVGMSPRKLQRIPADQIIHLYDPQRANQARGLSWYVAVMVALKMLHGYTEAELIAARTAAAKMGWFVKKDEAAAEVVADPVTNTITMEANPGTIEFAPDGYEFEAWSPEHPTTAFAAFVKMVLRETATGVGMSYNALANDLEGVNYSSMRSGLLLEREMWRTLQTWWIDSFRRRVYREWLNLALLKGAVVLDSRDSKKFLSARWHPRGWPWVDPLKDTQAGVLGVQTGLASRTALLAEQGLDFETVIEELAEEQAIADELGVNIAGPASGAAVEDDEDDEDDSDGDAASTKKKAKAKASGNGAGRSRLRGLIGSGRNGHG